MNAQTYQRLGCLQANEKNENNNFLVNMLPKELRKKMPKQCKEDYDCNRECMLVRMHVCLCIYVCVCECIYACMCICVCVCVCVCVNACMHAYAFACVCVCVCVCVHAYRSIVCFLSETCLYGFMSNWWHLYYTYIYTYSYAFLYVLMCIHV